ncbi:MAG: nitroreductase family protein [Prevotellaceae bacterium]|nr:nitroreductase family protein [Candidatus Minthosoma caballi]
MENFKELVQKRRSVRKFTDQDIAAEDLQTILRAALMSPTSKGTRAWHFIVVDDKEMLEKISLCRPMGSQFVAGAKVAIVVLGDREATDVWCEDASLAAVTMQYQATDLGLGSCWCQVRNRYMENGEPSDNILRYLLGYPEDLSAECVIGIGYPAIERKPQDEDNLKWENVHIGTFAEEEE